MTPPATSVETVNGHVVDESRMGELDCPECEGSTSAYYLGSTSRQSWDGVVLGWLCEECESELHELTRDDGETVAVVEVDASG